jgi:hypothetical protein
MHSSNTNNGIQEASHEKNGYRTAPNLHDTSSLLKSPHAQDSGAAVPPAMHRNSFPPTAKPEYVFQKPLDKVFSNIRFGWLVHYALLLLLLLLTSSNNSWSGPSPGKQVITGRSVHGGSPMVASKAGPPNRNPNKVIKLPKILGKWKSSCEK